MVKDVQGRDQKALNEADRPAINVVDHIGRHQRHVVCLPRGDKAGACALYADAKIGTSRNVCFQLARTRFRCSERGPRPTGPSHRLVADPTPAQMKGGLGAGGRTTGQ